MATVSKNFYERLIESRPVKFDSEEVSYREADGKEKCQSCQHFFERVIDKFHTCEIFRDEETDKDGVSPTGVCDFFTSNGTDFPLLDE